MSGIASNQIAAWVQDEEGRLVKTIYVSDFTAHGRGYRHRTESLSHWVSAANPESLSDSEIDNVSSATPQAGKQSYIWDLTDESGKRVSRGTYCIFLEGTLFWESNVVYTCVLDLNEDVPGEMTVQMERSEPDNTDNETMIQNVHLIAMADSIE